MEYPFMLPSASTLRDRLWRTLRISKADSTRAASATSITRDAEEMGHSGRGTVLQLSSPANLHNSRCIVNDVERQTLRHLRKVPRVDTAARALLAAGTLYRALYFDHDAYTLISCARGLCCAHAWTSNETKVERWFRKARMAGTEGEDGS